MNCRIFVLIDCFLFLFDSFLGRGLYDLALELEDWLVIYWEIGLLIAHLLCCEKMKEDLLWIVVSLLDEMDQESFSYSRGRFFLHFLLSSSLHVEINIVIRSIHTVNFLRSLEILFLID